MNILGPLFAASTPPSEANFAVDTDRERLPHWVISVPWASPQTTAVR